MFGQDIGIEISGKGWSIDCGYAHRFDALKPKPSRSVFTAGWRVASRGWSILIQMYRPGMELDWHTDGHGIHNHVWSFVLWQPKEGGRLEIEGPHRKWWRFYYFDGGLTKHRVTPCGSRRLVFMLQHMQKIKKG